MMFIVVGEARAVDGLTKCLENQILADAFGLESGVTTEGSCSLILYYDHIDDLGTRSYSVHTTFLLLGT